MVCKIFHNCIIIYLLEKEITMKRIIRLTESDLTRIVKRVIEESKNEQDEYEYEIRSVDCNDNVDDGHVGIDKYSDKIMIAYCNENPESLEQLKRKGRMLLKQKYAKPDFPNFSDDEQDTLSKMRGYFGNK